MLSRKLNVSEARRQFSRLIGGVSKPRGGVAITQHGKERAALIGIAEYRTLSEKAQAFDRSTNAKDSFALKGSLELVCSAEDLIEEMGKIRSRWSGSAKRSSEEIARKLARK